MEEIIEDLASDILSLLTSELMGQLEDLVKEGAEMLAQEAGLDLDEVMRMSYQDVKPEIENFVVNEGLEYLTIGDILNQAGSEAGVDLDDIAEGAQHIFDDSIINFIEHYAQLLAAELGLDSIEDVLYIRVKDIGQELNSFIEKEGLQYYTVEEILNYIGKQLEEIDVEGMVEDLVVDMFSGIDEYDMKVIGELAQRFANIYARTNGFEDMSEDDMELMRTTQTEILEWLKI